MDKCIRLEGKGVTYLLTNLSKINVVAKIFSEEKHWIITETAKLGFEDDEEAAKKALDTIENYLNSK